MKKPYLSALVAFATLSVATAGEAQNVNNNFNTNVNSNDYSAQTDTGPFNLGVSAVRLSPSNSSTQNLNTSGLSLTECKKQAAIAWGKLNADGFTDVHASCTGDGKIYTARAYDEPIPGKPRQLIWAMK